MSILGHRAASLIAAALGELEIVDDEDEDGRT